MIITNENYSPLKKQRLASSTTEETRKSTRSISQPVKMHIPLTPSSKHTENSTEGLIVSMLLEDFMCHQRLSIKFGPKTNWIEGANGSGKSAILTALILAFGGSAQSTNRASINKNLVREGANSATITIKLNNKQDPYKQEILGEYIFIERRISIDYNSSGVKIKSASGKIVYSKKEDLMKIMDHFGIQTNNPITIMDQETTKMFLRSIDGKSKYKLFMTGSNLDKLLEDHETIRKAIVKTNDLIEIKRNIFPKLKQEYKEAKKKYNVLEEAEGFKKKIDELKHQLAWKQIHEMQAEYDKKLQELEDTKKKNVNRDGEISRLNTKITEIRQNIQNNNTETSNFIEGIKKNNKRKDDITKEKQKFKIEIKSIEENELEINSQITKARKETQEYQDKIDLEAKSTGDERELKIKKINHEIEVLEQKQSRFNEKENEFNNSLNKLYSNKKGLKEEISIIQDNVKEKIQKGESIKNRIKDLISRKQNNMRAYGNNIEKVLKEIEDENNFKMKPIGPFGRYTRLKHNEWAETIESILGSALNAFWVSCYEDQERLSRILSKNNCHSNIFVSKVDNFDFSRGEPDKKYLTILRAFEIKNEIVLRQLIVNFKIEKIILIKERRNADDVMYKIPENVIACYTINGYQVGHRGGGYASMALNIHKGLPRLGQNVDTIIEHERMKYDTVNKLILEENHKIRELEDKLKSLNHDISVSKNEILQIKEEIKLNINGKNTLQNELEKLTQLVNTNVFQEAIAEANVRINILKNQFVALQSKKKQAQDKLMELSQEQLHIAQLIDETIEKKNEIQTKSEHLYGELSQFESELKTMDNDKTDYKEAAQVLAEELIQDKQKLEKSTELVERAFPVLKETDKTSSLLKKEISNFEKKLEYAQEDIGCNVEQYKLKLRSKLTALNQATTDINLMQEFVEELNSSLRLRVERYDQFREIIDKRAKKNYIWHLTMRGYHGELKINHEKKELETIMRIEEHQVKSNEALDRKQISIKSNDSRMIKKSKTVKLSSNDAPDNKSLSGGEKSYCTICLLLSLWESMSSPIRCLDEYDVYMDSANRKISTRMIEDSADAAPNVQYIMITPLGLGFVADSIGTRKIKLNAPERNQRTLNFNSQ